MSVRVPGVCDSALAYLGEGFQKYTMLCTSHDATYAGTHVVFALGVNRGAISEARQLVGTVRLTRRRVGRDTAGSTPGWSCSSRKDSYSSTLLIYKRRARRVGLQRRHPAPLVTQHSQLQKQYKHEKLEQTNNHRQQATGRYIPTLTSAGNFHAPSSHTAHTSFAPAPSRMHSGGQHSTSGQVTISRRLLEPSRRQRYTSTLAKREIPAA